MADNPAEILRELAGLLHEGRALINPGPSDEEEEEEEADPAVDGDELEDLEEEYANFHWGTRPDRIAQVDVTPPRTLVGIGELEAVVYRTKKGERRQASWIHELGEDGGSKPILAYDPESDQLYIIGGDYKITPRGIEG